MSRIFHSLSHARENKDMYERVCVQEFSLFNCLSNPRTQFSCRVKFVQLRRKKDVFLVIKFHKKIYIVKNKGKSSTKNLNNKFCELNTKFTQLINVVQYWNHLRDKDKSQVKCVQ